MFAGFHYYTRLKLKKKPDMQGIVHRNKGSEQSMNFQQFSVKFFVTIINLFIYIFACTLLPIAMLPLKFIYWTLIIKFKLLFRPGRSLGTILKTEKLVSNNPFQFFLQKSISQRRSSRVSRENDGSSQRSWGLSKGEDIQPVGHQYKQRIQ